MCPSAAHQHSAGSIDAASVPWLLMLGLALASYVYGIRRQRRRGRPWNRWRTAGFVLALVSIGLMVSGPVATLGHSDLRWHMVQHLCIGMLAPLGLVLGAPITLALRSLPKARARMVTSLLRSPPLHALGHPVTASVANIGGMYALYATGLYAAMLSAPWLHQLVHVHFLLAGCLFTWALAGPDPGPARPPHAVRLTVLFVSIAAHGVLAKLMYAHGWPRGTPHGAAEIQEAAQWMYYGGDAAELLLAAVLLGSWKGFPDALPILDGIAPGGGKSRRRQ